jgi:MFS family permease
MHAGEKGQAARGDRPAVTGRYAAYALGLLTLINLLNYLDRNVIFALFEPLKRDLNFTDTQLGWLGSAYILVYSLAALPFGVISDLRSRRAVIAGGVAVWSAFTFLGGLVRNFTQLFVCRAVVGIGEAAFAPAASSLVADYFPGKGRATAMGILSAGLAIGGVLGILLGGTLEQAYGWRVAFMAVGVPGFLLALLASRLIDPSGRSGPVPVRPYVKDEGLVTVIRQFYPLILSLIVGTVVARLLDWRYGEDSRVDVAALGAIVGIGVVVQIYYWVRSIRAGKLERTPFGYDAHTALDELLGALQRVLRTPTLTYVFVAGAMISFGMNGLVGWGPAFLARELGLTSGEAAKLLGVTGLIAGVAGTLAGGFVADWWLRRNRRARVFTVAVGLLIGGPLALWLMTVRDPGVFRFFFGIAFFFLSWYNGPLNATIFDVVPSRIGATVAGAYFLFIHLAGDAIAFPLVGALSDRFGLERAVFILPAVSILGGLVVLGAAHKIVGDVDRLAAET